MHPLMWNCNRLHFHFKPHAVTLQRKSEITVGQNMFQSAFGDIFNGKNITISKTYGSILWIKESFFADITSCQTQKDFNACSSTAAEGKSANKVKHSVYIL